MDKPLRVLIVEDSDKDVALEVRALTAAGYQVNYVVAVTADEMKAALAEQAFDIVISDHDLPQFDAPGALAVLQQSDQDIPFIIVSGVIGEEMAVALMKAGAHDYVMKNNLARLVPAVQRELSEAKSRTERRRAEEELKASEERFRTAAENLTDVIYDWDIKDKIDWYGDIDSVMGYPPGEFPRTLTAWAATIHAEDKDRVMAALEDHVKGVVPFVIEYRVERRNGESRWWSARGTALRDARGKPYKMIGSITDITDRKQAESTLKKSEEEFRSLAESMPQIVWVTRKDGWNIYFNQQWVDYTGLTLEESYGHGWNIPFHPDDKQEAWDAWQNAIENNGIYSIESRLRRKDGVYHWWLVRGVPLFDETGEIIKWFGTCTDIDNIKLTEKQLLVTLDSLRKSFGATIHVLVSAVELRDLYTAGHQLRVADLARTIAIEMGLPQDKIDGIEMAGSIHDIGKISIPAEILSKTTKLTHIEFSMIKEHPKTGYEMLKDMESPWPLAQIVYQHHERMDGSGYPRHLKGNEILIEARIMAVADVVEAMASHRPYRASLGIDAALNEISSNRGIFYESEVVDTCLRLFNEKGYKFY